MKTQNQWLFEAPLTNESVFYSSHEYESYPELGFERKLWEGNPYSTALPFQLEADAMASRPKGGRGGRRSFRATCKKCSSWVKNSSLLLGGLCRDCYTKSRGGPEPIWPKPSKTDDNSNQEYKSGWLFETPFASMSAYRVYDNPVFGMEQDAALFMDIPPDIFVPKQPSEIFRAITDTLRSVAPLVLPAIKAKNFELLMNTALYLISPEVWSKVNDARRRTIARSSLLNAANQLGLIKKPIPATKPSVVTPKPPQGSISPIQVKQSHREQLKKGRKPGQNPAQKKRKR